MTDKPHPPTDRLKRRLTVSDAESEMDRQSAEIGKPLNPNWLEHWDEFKAQLQSGDELWYWEYFPEAMTGGAGYCIVRNGKSIATITTMRS